MLQFGLSTNDSRLTTASMGVLRQMAEYLYLKKKDPNAPDTQWVRYMHGINRISLLLFLFAIVVLVIKLFVKR